MRRPDCGGSHGCTSASGNASPRTSRPSRGQFALAHSAPPVAAPRQASLRVKLLPCTLKVAGARRLQASPFIGAMRSAVRSPRQLWPCWRTPPSSATAPSSFLVCASRRRLERLPRALTLSVSSSMPTCSLLPCTASVPLSPCHGRRPLMLIASALQSSQRRPLPTRSAVMSGAVRAPLISTWPRRLPVLLGNRSASCTGSSCASISRRSPTEPLAVRRLLPSASLKLPSPCSPRRANLPWASSARLRSVPLMPGTSTVAS